MTTKIQPHSENKLEIMFKGAGCADQFLQKFKDEYFEIYNEFVGNVKTDGSEDDLKYLNEAKNDASWLTLERIKHFMEEINSGHSEEWASLIISGILYDGEEDYGDAIRDAYYELAKKDRELANREIKIQSKAFGEDKHFERYFVSIFTDDYLSEKPIEFAKNYSDCYKKLIEKGESEIYAHHYADQNASGQYAELYCDKFAYAMEKMLAQGIHNGAYCIADDFATNICNDRILFSCMDENFEYLLENKKYLLNYFDDIPDNITREKMQDLICKLYEQSEEELADFVLDSIILNKKKEQILNK